MMNVCIDSLIFERGKQNASTDVTKTCFFYHFDDELHFVIVLT